MDGTINQTSLADSGRRPVPAFLAAPLGPLLTRALRALARRRPEIFERLGAHRRARYRLDTIDMPFAFSIVPDGVSAMVRAVQRDHPEPADVVIRGPILMLLGLLDGTFDGDALFFHRTISISGRTEAVVALRNAIECAELRPADLLGLPGEAGRLADRAILSCLDVLRGIAAGAARWRGQST